MTATGKRPTLSRPRSTISPSTTRASPSMLYGWRTGSPTTLSFRRGHLHQRQVRRTLRTTPRWRLFGSPLLKRQRRRQRRLMQRQCRRRQLGHMPRQSCRRQLELSPQRGRRRQLGPTPWQGCRRQLELLPQQYRRRQLGYLPRPRVQLDGRHSVVAPPRRSNSAQACH